MPALPTTLTSRDIYDAALDMLAPRSNNIETRDFNSHSDFDEQRDRVETGQRVIGGGIIAVIVIVVIGFIASCVIGCVVFRRLQRRRKERDQMQQQQQVSSSSRPPSRAMSTMSTMSSKERSRERPDSRRTSRSIHSSHPSGSGHRRRHSSTTNVHNPKMVESRPMRGVTGPGAGPPPGPGDSQSNGSTTNNHGYDVKSMHNVAMTGLK